MALDRLTKITGPGIHTLSNVLSHNIKSSGIITATKFVGPIEGVITSTDATFTGNVTIGGTLTYEDVTNIDSVGIITAQKDIHVGAGLSVVGVSTFSDDIKLPDDTFVRLGDLSTGDFTINHDGARTMARQHGIGSFTLDLLTSSNTFNITKANLSETIAKFIPDGAVELYHNNVKRFETSSVGVSIPQDLDVDGHTNLDNVSVVGFSTFTGSIDVVSTDSGAAAAPILDLIRNSSSAADNDLLGQLRFSGKDDQGSAETYAYITGKILDASAGGEDGILEFTHRKNSAFVITGRWRSDSLQLLNDTNFSVAGDTTLIGDIDVDGHTNLDNVSIAGVSTFAGNVVIADSIVHDGDTNTQIRFPAADTIRFEVGNQQAVHILPASAGSGGARMGLGTNSPTGMLHIYGSNPPFRIQNSNDSANLQIGMWDTSNVMFQVSHRPFKLATETSHPIVFHTGGLNNERLRIDSSGNVGIDETGTILGKFHVVGGRASGTAYNAAVFAGGQNSTSGSGVKLYLSGCENDPISRGVILESIMTDNANAHRFSILVGGSSAAPTERFRITSSGAHFYGNQTNLPNGIFGFRYDKSNDTDLSIENLNNSSVNNNAGIRLATNHSNIKLRYFNNGGFYITNASTAGYLHYYEGSDSRLYIDTSGNISINNPATPPTSNGSVGKRLGIKSNANNVIIGETESSGNGSGLHIESRQTGRSGDARIAQIGLKNNASGDGQISFFTAPSSAGVSERLTITSDGQIGVNQASPKAWHSSYRSIQIHNGASLYGSSDVSFVGLGANHYLNTSGNFIYSNTDFASRFYQVNGEFYFEGAPSSNAGNTFSFTQRLRITSTGQIRIDQATSANNGIRMRPSGWGYDFRMGAVSSSGGSIWLGQNYEPTGGTRDSSSYGTNYLRFTTQGEIMLGTGATNTNPTERIRIKSNGNVGINEDDPQTTLNVRGCISTGRNVAREVGQIIDISSSYSGSRNGVSVINGQKNYEENPSADWITANGQRVNANLTIDLQAQYTCDRFVIYNQNEYTNNVREVKHFTLEGSNDKSSWTTLLDDECGASYAHEPNPGFSFRIPSDFTDDDEGATFRYWRFTMKDYHGSTTLGGVMELELYEVDSSNKTISEVSTHHLSAMDITAQNIYHDLPAFYVARSSAQGSMSDQTWTKIAYTDDNSGAFDTSGEWSNSNYRFTPTIPGYYQFQMNQSISHGSVQASYIAIYKNGSAYCQTGRYFFSGDNYDDAVLNTSCLMHCDGQSDYVEFYAWRYGGSSSFGGSSALSQASGFLVRHAGYRRHGDGV